MGVKDTEADELSGWERLYALSRAVQRAREAGDVQRAQALEDEWLALRTRLLDDEATP
ncbi:MAG: hypothetical protein RLP09_18005 [Sandaracinaceae bacterium]